MDASERLSISIAVQEVLQLDPLSCDALISAFVAALKTHRRGSVCRPIPRHIKPWDKQAAATSLDLLPGTLSLLADCQQLQTASDQQLQILQWLLLLRPGSFHAVSPKTVCQQLEAQLPSLPQDLQSCRCILCINPHGNENTCRGPGVLAWHGTAFENVHSILHNGLLAASGTRLETSGALFGSGVYLSSDYSVAYAFSRGSEGWRNSSIGRVLRCVLLCEVDAKAAIQRGSSGSSLPDKYILVPRPQDVAVRYILIYSDDAMLGRSLRGRHRGAAVCLYVTLSYLLFIVLLSAWRSWS